MPDFRNRNARTQQQHIGAAQVVPLGEDGGIPSTRNFYEDVGVDQKGLQAPSLFCLSPLRSSRTLRYREDRAGLSRFRQTPAWRPGGCPYLDTFPAMLAAPIRKPIARTGWHEYGASSKGRHPGRAACAS